MRTLFRSKNHRIREAVTELSLLEQLTMFMTMVGGVATFQPGRVHATLIRIIYGATSGAHSPVWVAREKDLIKKRDTQLSHIPPTQAIQALIAGDIQFTTASAVIVYLKFVSIKPSDLVGLTRMKELMK